MQPLTTNQTRIVQQLSQDDMTPSFCVEIIEAAMRYRNACSPSGVTSKQEAQARLFAAIDRVT